MIGSTFLNTISASLASLILVEKQILGFSFFGSPINELFNTIFGSAKYYQTGFKDAFDPQCVDPEYAKNSKLCQDILKNDIDVYENLVKQEALDPNYKETRVVTTSHRAIRDPRGETFPEIGVKFNY
jgi:hypothetical protein